MNATDQVCEDCGIVRGPELASYQNGPEAIVLYPFCAALWRLSLLDEQQADSRFKMFDVDARGEDGHCDADDLVAMSASPWNVRS